MSVVLQVRSTGTSPSAPAVVNVDRQRPVLTDLIWSNRSDVPESPSRTVHFWAVDPSHAFIVIPVPAPLPAVTHMFPMPRHSTPESGNTSLVPGESQVQLASTVGPVVDRMPPLTFKQRAVLASMLAWNRCVAEPRVHSW